MSAAEYVDPHPGLRGSDRVAEPCGRCSGSGLYSGPTSAAWENGSGRGSLPYCFYCGGAGSRSVLVSSVRARVRREIAQAAEDARLTAEAEARREAWLAAGHGDLLAEGEKVREGLRSGDPIARRLGYALDDLNTYTASAEHADAVREILTEIADREAARVDVVEGRREIVGEVLRVKWQENSYGGSLKMLLQEPSGARVWGSVPRSIDVEEGDRVRLTATVERSSDSRDFGFFSRPTRAEVLPAE